MRPVGWRYESVRHSLAAKGVHTVRYDMVRAVPRKILPQIEFKQIEKAYGADALNEAKRLVQEEGFTARELVDHYNLPYLRKFKYQPVPEGREDIDTSKVLMRGELGPREVEQKPPEPTEEEVMRTLLNAEGRVLFEKRLQQVRNRLYYLLRAYEGTSDDLAKAEGVKNISQIDFMRKRLVEQHEEISDLYGTLEIMGGEKRRGEFEKYVPERMRGEIVERLFERTAGPKRQAAIEDALENPVVPVVPQEPLPKQPDRAMQLRLVKFMARKRRERLVGGLADGLPDSRFDQRQLRRGIRVELEHTRSRAVAKEIAKDHLVEDKRYYEKLEKMEGSL